MRLCPSSYANFDPEHIGRFKVDIFGRRVILSGQVMCKPYYVIGEISNRFFSVFLYFFDIATNQP